jgi:peptidoglycan/LPS O-acetylase OafA/YrhL
LLILVLPLLWTFPLLSKPFSHPPASFAELALNYSLVPIGYFGVLGLSLSSTPARGLFSLKPLRLLGKYSYGLYVLHLILLGYLEPPMRDGLRRLHVPNLAAIFLVGIGGFAISLCAAVLSYQLYERHFLRLKRFFDYRPHGSSASVSSSPAPADHVPATPALH